MSKSDTPVILFYPTGVVHFRNLEILKRKMAGFQFRVIVEEWVLEKAGEVLDSFKEEDRVMVSQGIVPVDTWESVDILFLSMAYPNPFRLTLAREAARRSIPVTAIEEVNQLALNDGIINHYFMPLDYFGVPSDEEKDRFKALGIAGTSIKVTGWPFFDPSVIASISSFPDLKEQYNVPENKKCCLLVLGSLKEHDMVSLETRKVRKFILDVIAGGLPEDYCVMIKPHPIETESGVKEIRKQIRHAVIVDPKHPIEPLLAQADLIVNRGNSQVVLLAMLLKKPLIIVPAGLNTIFHGLLEEVTADSKDEFRAVVDAYDRGRCFCYDVLLKKHFPLNRDEALTQVQRMFAVALRDGVSGGLDSLLFISILFAFLNDVPAAVDTLPETLKENVRTLLLKLFNKQIDAAEFKVLLGLFPKKIHQLHLQALFIRALAYKMEGLLSAEAMLLLDGFDGKVNPHYFIDDLVKRVDLEFRTGGRDRARLLMKGLYEDYAVFPFYKQAFDMMRFVYGRKSDGTALITAKKALWLLMNFNKGFTRRFLKEKLVR